MNRETLKSARATTGCVIVGVLFFLVSGSASHAALRALLSGDTLMLEITMPEYAQWAMGLLNFRAGCAVTGQEIDYDDPASPLEEKCACERRGSTGTGYGKDDAVNRIALVQAEVQFCREVPTNAVTASIIGEWTYSGGSLTDTHFFHADGRVFGSGGRRSTGQGNWVIAGNTLTVTWTNGWTNVYTLGGVPAGRLAGTLTGTATPPASSGSTTPLNITLGRT